jgi:hypothetical protein
VDDGVYAVELIMIRGSPFRHFWPLPQIRPDPYTGNIHASKTEPNGKRRRNSCYFFKAESKVVLRFFAGT